MAERLADGVWLLELGWVAPLRSNAYLADDDGTLTLIDAGLHWNRNPLVGEIEATGHAADAVERVLLTHYDLDHVGGLSRLPNRQATVHIGESDARLLSGEWTPSPFHHKGAFHRVARRLFPLPDDLAVHRLGDGQQVGGFTAHHSPGHNPGHMVYVNERLDAGFFGDLVWAQSDGLTHPFWLDSYDMRELRESIRRVAERIPAFDLLCVGHGRPIVPDGSERFREFAASLSR